MGWVPWWLEAEWECKCFELKTVRRETWEESGEGQTSRGNEGRGGKAVETPKRKARLDKRLIAKVKVPKFKGNWESHFRNINKPLETLPTHLLYPDTISHHA